MIKNIIFDIGNVILNFKILEVLEKFTDNSDERQFIYEHIICSPEWLGFGLIDTGYITREEAINMAMDRTNHVNDFLIEKFWNSYNNYAFVDERVLDLIKQLKENHYNVYLLSNINPYTAEFVSKSGLFDIVDGYVLSYEVHQIKPYISIYKTLLNKYKLVSSECLFVDDRKENVDTANDLGILGENVLADDFLSIIKLLDKYDIRYSLGDM